MKKYLTILLLSVSLTGSFTGCKSGPEVTAYKTSVAISVSVDTAMKIWAEASISGKTTLEQDNQVRKYHDIYLSSVRLERDAIYAYKTSGDNSALIVATKAAADSKLDLLTFIQKLGVKLQ